MKCDMVILVQGPDERGWRKWRCSRAGCTKKTNWTPDKPEKITFVCTGLPHAHEWGQWVSFWLGVIGLRGCPLAALKRWLGFAGDCSQSPCDKRAEKWDKVGARVAAWFRRSPPAA
jgi:hypothetical protein